MSIWYANMTMESADRYLPNQLESCDARCETSLPEIGIRNLVDKEYSQILSIMSLIEDLKYIVNKI